MKIFRFPEIHLDKVHYKVIAVARRALLILLLLFSVQMAKAQSVSYYLSPDGSDNNKGTAEAPFASLDKVKGVILDKDLIGNATINIVLKDGLYLLDSTFVLPPDMSGTREHPVRIVARNEGKAILSGAVHLSGLEWKAHKKGIYRAEVPQNILDRCRFDELWLGERKFDMARFPNVRKDELFKGVTTLETLNQRAARYDNPQTGFVHALHGARWGSVHYRVTGYENSELQLEGGWQQNRNKSMKKDRVMVENIFEELDHPGEWYLERGKGVLYVYPPENMELSKMTAYAVNLKNLIHIKGEEQNPVSNIHIGGIEFRQSRCVFMDDYEPLLRGDWSINRSGAILMEGTEHCLISDCFFNQSGGNGVFFSNYNRYSDVVGCRFEKLGESAVCFVGNYACTRGNPIGYNNSLEYNQVAWEPGPRCNDYPQQCTMEGSLVFATGRVGKQTAGAFISMSEQITIRHNTMYHLPRSGITINDGSWGGHVIEYNHVFNTVTETGDHGPFNSWGRDRYWKTQHHSAGKGDESGARERSTLDNHLTTHIRNNRFEHGDGHSWGIDLDDGSSNYHVYNNLCLGCSYKLREGYYRVVENNITIGPNAIGKHVSFKENSDIIRNNIHVTTHKKGVVFHGIHISPFGMKAFNNNLYYATKTAQPKFIVTGTIPEGLKREMTFREWQAAGLDVDSRMGRPLFVNPEKGDFRVKNNSPALKLGFKNFAMNEFGVQKKELKRMAQKDYEIYHKFDVGEALKRSRQTLVEVHADEKVYDFMGARVKDLNQESEKSVAGVGELAGVFVLEVKQGSKADKLSIHSGDAITAVQEERIRDYADMMQKIRSLEGEMIRLRLVGATDRTIMMEKKR